MRVVEVVIDVSYPCVLYVLLSDKVRALNHMPYERLSQDGMFAPQALGALKLTALKGRELQLNHRFKRKWQVEYLRFNMFRAWYHQHEHRSSPELAGMSRTSFHYLFEARKIGRAHV